MILQVLLASIIVWCCSAERLSENERVKQWIEKYGTHGWPPAWQPESELMKEHMTRREIELQHIPGANERWENYMQYTQSRMVPRFTEVGFEVIQTPPAVHAKLKAAVDEGLKRWDQLREERQIDAVYTPIPSKFIDLYGLDNEAMLELRQLHEEWSGISELVPTSAYGVRLYRNGSALAMHYDKIFTHVISSIVHIAHEYDDDSEPWPIEIEDHNGQLHAVSLKAGEMLFYESAACLHGRRQTLKGKYYASIFVHYMPKEKSIWDFSLEDVINNVPPHWRQGVIEGEGSRWAGQCLTVDSCVTDLVPPRTVKGEIVHNITQYYLDHKTPHYYSARHIPLPPKSEAPPVRLLEDDL